MIKIGSAPPGQAAIVITPTDASKGAAVMVGEIPREPLGFQPRTDLLEALDAPGPGSRVVVIHALTGLRGVGKTHLAAAYSRAKLAERWRNEYGVLDHYVTLPSGKSFTSR